MPNKLLDSLQSLFKARNLEPFDPSVFQDSLALKTQWTALKNGGTNFRTHGLVSTGSARLEFKPTPFAWVFYFIFILPGAALSVGLPILFFTKPDLISSDKNAIIVPLIIGVVFLSIGLLMAYSGSKPIVFDQMRMLFWKGRPRGEGRIRRESFSEACELSQIHALQIIAEYCRGNKSSYYSYELNLVLEDGSRMNVVDHGSLTALKKDAQKLAGFLNVPLWDQTQREPLYSPLTGNEEPRSKHQGF